MLRAEKTTAIPEGMHWYRLAFKTIPAFIFVYTYTIMCLNPNIKTRALFYLNLPIVVFFSTLTLHKTPIAYLILYALLIKFFLRGKPLGFGRLLAYASFGIGTITIFLRLYLLNLAFFDFLEKVPYYLFRRICISYTRTHALIIQIFPDQHDYFFGTAFFNPGRLLPFEPVNLSQFLGLWTKGKLMNRASASFSQGFANFGFSGLILAVLLMFVQILILQIIFKKCPKNIVFLSVYVMLIPNMLAYAHKSIQSTTSLVFVIFSLTIIFAYYTLQGFKRKLYKFAG
jgi:hypothetical protein